MRSPLVVLQDPAPLALVQLRSIPLRKPLPGQSEALQIGPGDTLDLSSIANETIALVKLGNRLVVLFPDRAYVVVDGLYLQTGQFTPDIRIGLDAATTIDKSDDEILFYCGVLQAIVHDDEGGQPHLHFCFVPVVEDPKHEQGYKICANDVLDRRELRNFHPDLQRYLNEHGLEDARVMTGVTKRQGGNRTVAQLKAEREYQQEVERPALYFGESKIEQGLHF